MAVKIRRTVKYEVEVPGLGEKIKQARDKSDKSLVKLAKEAGVSRYYWYKIESENIDGGVSEETLRKIEEVLGVDFGITFED